MTKQQLLALLREAYRNGAYDVACNGKAADNAFIAEIERTNRVGDLELPDLPQQPDND